MQVGDLIRFSSTGVQGIVTKIDRTHASPEKYVHVLCGPDADGEHSGAVLAFRQDVIKAEVISASR